MMKLKKRFIQLFVTLSITSIFFQPVVDVTSADGKTPTENQVSFNITDSSNNFIEIVLSAPAYQIEEVVIQDQTFNNILVPGAKQSSEPGQLQFPFASKLIAVPPLAEVGLEIVEASYQPITENLLLARAPLPAHLEDINSTQRWDYKIQPTPNNYENLTSPVRISGDAWIRNQRVVRLEYYPITVNHETGDLSWNSNVKVKIHFYFPFGQGKSSATSLENQEKKSSLYSIPENYLLNGAQSTSFETTDLPVNVLVNPPDVGARYRIAIDEDGIYTLTYEDLYQANPAITDINPNDLSMTNQGQDVSIHIEDGGDGSFDLGDYVIFYGQKFYGERLADLYQNENKHWYTYNSQDTNGVYYDWKPKFNQTMLQKYTDQNIYWLFEGDGNGLRMETIPGDPDGNNNDPVPYYRNTVRIEENYLWKTTLFAGEETWFWEIITKDSLYEYDVNLTSPENIGPEAIIRADFVSNQGNELSGIDHQTKIYFNDKKLDEFTWSGKSRYEFSDVITTTIAEGNNKFGIEAIETSQIVNPSYYFDWFEIEYNRQYVAENNAIFFTSPITGSHKYQVTGFTETSPMWILDISDPSNPLRVQGASIGTNQVTFALNHDDLTIAMDSGGKNLSSGQVSYYQPPNWPTINAGADYVFITHSVLTETTQIFADYRRSRGLETVVIDINDLYNEFNFGIYHPIAIKNFLSYAFENWQTVPTYTLLVGDGHWNFFDYNLTKYGTGLQLIPPNLVWADPWQGEVDSANLLANVVGDDPFPDLMIARLPVNNNDELNAYIEKMIDYEKIPAMLGGQTHIFVAEDPDMAGDFTSFAEEIVTKYIEPFEYAYPLEIYEEDYGCVTSTSVECDNVRSAIIGGINNGALFLNYIGHGSVNWWSHQQVFTPLQFTDLNNTAKLPIILSMTCLDGYWNGPSISPGHSMIEQLVRMDSVGAIGAFSPTGLGVSTGHDVLHKGFYDSMVNAGIWELGQAAQISKLWLFETGTHLDLLHTFTVFGDPALQIPKPFGSYLPLVRR